jgi:hypothetical protein
MQTLNSAKQRNTIDMPNLEEHCQHSERRYGVKGEDIHSWMDEPSQVAGGSHREYRHDLNSLQTAIQLFGKQYGAEMVENIFLDHLKADSAENRKRVEVIEEGSASPKLWTKEEDDYLVSNFLRKSDAEMEAELKIKTRASIQKRRQYLKLLRPKGIQRTRKRQREQRLVFRLTRGQKIYLNMDIEGGNNDIDFSITNYKLDGICQERVIEKKEIVFEPRSTDNYSFIFSNSFSWRTNKKIIFRYRLEDGPEARIGIGL